MSDNRERSIVERLESRILLSGDGLLARDLLAAPDSGAETESLNDQPAIEELDQRDAQEQQQQTGQGGPSEGEGGADDGGDRGAVGDGGGAEPGENSDGGDGDEPTGDEPTGDTDNQAANEQDDETRDNQPRITARQVAVSDARLVEQDTTDSGDSGGGASVLDRTTTNERTQPDVTVVDSPPTTQGSTSSPPTVSTISSIQIDTEPIADGDADDSDDNSDDNNNNSNNNSDNNSDNSDVRGVGDDRNDSSDDGATNEADADSENDDNDSRPTDSSDKETPAAESDSGESDGSAVAPVGRIDIASTGHDTIRPVIAAQTQDTSVPAEGEPAIAQSHGHRPVATGAAAATLQADSQTASTQEVGLGTAAATTSSGDRALPVVSGALLAVTMGKPLSRLGATGDATTDGGAAEARGASGGSVAWDERRRQQRSNRVAKTKRHENDQPREDSPHREAGSDQQAGGGPIDFAADQRGSADSTPISPPAAALASSPSQSPSEWDQMEILAIASSGVTVGAVSMLAMGRSRRTQPSAGTQPIGPAYTGTTMASGGHGG